ncbi:MAG: VanZ family protein [Cryobacterium sp.]
MSRNEVIALTAGSSVRRDSIRERLALHRIAVALLLGYLLALALIAFWPTPVDRAGHDSLTRLLAWLQVQGAPAWLTYGLVEFGANIILFIPAGLLVVVLAGARFWWLGLVGGFLASCTIELGQLLLLPARTASARDIVANTSGALAGSMLALLLFALIALRARRRERNATAARAARPARER